MPKKSISRRMTRSGRGDRSLPSYRMARVRPPMARMSRIHAEIAKGKLPNCSTLARELEVSAKTVQRDIDFMRDQLELPIDYDEVRHGFHYTRPVKGFPPVVVTHGEIVSLLVAQKAVEQYRDTPFRATLETAFNKLVDGLDAEEAVSWESLGEAVSFRSPAVSSREILHFQTIAEATIEGREIEFDYFKLHAKKADRRRVQPYHLACVAGVWYLLGLDLLRGACRTFNLVRVSRVCDLKTRFKRPRDFKVEEFFKDSFTAFESGSTERVRVRFTGASARLVAEQKRHPSQRVKRGGNGEVVVTFQVGLTPDIESWILSWGSEAEVLAPAVLRERVAERHRAAAAVYG